MRHTLRLLAEVKPGRYLEAGNPTGLTGLFTHPAPRTALLYTYATILNKLQDLPDYSVYRQSTEALTKHRMNIIHSIKPKGYDEWAAKAKEKREKYPEAFKPGGLFLVTPTGNEDIVIPVEVEPEPEPEKEAPKRKHEMARIKTEVRGYDKEDYDFLKEDFDELDEDGDEEDEKDQADEAEEEDDESTDPDEKADVIREIEEATKVEGYEGETNPNDRPSLVNLVDWQPEPPLEASQCVSILNPPQTTRQTPIAPKTRTLTYPSLIHRISEAETRIGGGLIEEVIEVAEGELKLLETMLESKPYVPPPLVSIIAFL